MRNKIFEKPIRMSFIVEKDFLKQYKKFCVNNDFVMSERIRDLVEKDFEKNSKKDNH